MIKWIPIFLIIAVFWGSIQIPPVAVAQTRLKEKKGQCLTQWQGQSLALGALDWPQLERLGKKYLQDCKGVLDSEFESAVWEHIAIANNELNNPANGLSASETCIGIFYANSSCHIQKVRALIKLKRFAEARTEFEITERLVVQLIEWNAKSLREASEPIEKEVWSSKLYNLTMQKELLNKLLRPILY